MIDRIIALLEQMDDDVALEMIYWYVERKLMQQPPKAK